MLARTHAWSRTRKSVLLATVLIAIIAFAAFVYAYERYYRGPSDSVLVGTWQCTSGCEYALYYQFGRDHNIQVMDDQDPSVVAVRGRWYAGGDFIYLRFFELPPGVQRTILIYHIVDITPDELRVRIWRDDPIRSYRRVHLDSTTAPRLNFVVQHFLGLKEALIGCFVAMSFPWSVVDVFGD